MHDSRIYFTCAAVAGCVTVVGGGFPQRKSAEAYDEVLGRWLRLPHDLHHDSGLRSMGSALLWTIRVYMCAGCAQASTPDEMYVLTDVSTQTRSGATS
jgi:hypothetical protein